MTATSTRRAVLAGAAALPALSVPALASIAGDPIFAAIERHRAAYVVRMEKCQIQSETADYDPANADIVAAADDACDEASAAANALLVTPPTTMAGILALLQYVEDFNNGMVWLESTRNSPPIGQWRSGPSSWPPVDGDPDVDMFGYKLMANIHAALKTVAGVRS